MTEINNALHGILEKGWYLYENNSWPIIAIVRSLLATYEPVNELEYE